MIHNIAGIVVYDGTRSNPNPLLPIFGNIVCMCYTASVVGFYGHKILGPKNSHLKKTDCCFPELLGGGADNVDELCRPCQEHGNPV
jgi:hypothetical protein